MEMTMNIVRQQVLTWTALDKPMHNYVFTGNFFFIRISVLNRNGEAIEVMGGMRLSAID